MNTELTQELSLKEYGHSVRKTIPFFQQIVEFMENPKTREFYRECMNNATLKSTLIFLWTYEKIEEQIEKKYDIQLSSSEKVSILHQIMHNRNVQEQLLEFYREDNENIDTLLLEQ